MAIMGHYAFQRVNSRLPNCRKCGKIAYYERLQTCAGRRYGDRRKEANPMEHRLMTLQEQAAIIEKSHKLRESGMEDEATALRRSVPVPAYLAKVFKEKVGADFLRQGGWNLAEAEEEFGQDWLTQ
jgi:ribosomal protein L37E